MSRQVQIVIEPNSGFSIVADCWVFVFLGANKVILYHPILEMFNEDAAIRTEERVREIVIFPGDAQSLERRTFL
jgi:hypothetical protein